MKKIDLKNEKSSVVKVEQIKDRYLFTLRCDYERFARCPLKTLMDEKYVGAVKFIGAERVAFVVKELVAPVIYSVVKRYCDVCDGHQRQPNDGGNGSCGACMLQEQEVQKQKVRSR